MGIEQDKDRGEKKKAAGRVGMTLAAAIAAATPGGAPAQEATANLTQDYQSSDTYSDGDGGTSYEMYEPSEEVMSVLRGLDAELGGQYSITQDQISTIHAAVDKYVSEHPEQTGKITRTEGFFDGTSGGSESSSYSPYFEIEDALMRGPNLNPLVMGFTLGYVKDLMAAKSKTISEQK